MTNPLQKTDDIYTRLSQRIDYLERIIDERQEFIKDALKLNATEMHRRLELLNGEAERLRLIQATYLPRELYETTISLMQKTLFDIQTAMAHQQGRSQIITIVVSTGISLVVALITIFSRRYLW